MTLALAIAVIIFVIALAVWVNGVFDKRDAARAARASPPLDYAEQDAAATAAAYDIGRHDYWRSPETIVERGRGDCEDIAISGYTRPLINVQALYKQAKTQTSRGK